MFPKQEFLRWDSLPPGVRAVLFEGAAPRSCRPCAHSFGGTEGGIWHKASVSDCLPLAAPVGLSPLLILTLCGSEREEPEGGGGHLDFFGWSNSGGC